MSENIYHPGPGRTRRTAYEKLQRPGYESWEGRESLSLTSKTMLRITMGGVIYIVHSIQRHQGHEQGKAEHFIRADGDYEYEGRIDEVKLVQHRFRELLEGDMFYFRLTVGDEQMICIPPAQRIEVNSPIPKGKA